MRLLPCGDAAVLVELGTLADVQRAYRVVRDRALPGVVDLVPAARTLLVRLDPARTDRRAVGEAVAGALDTAGPAGEEPVAGPTRSVPVVYDGEDLDDVAALTGWSVDEVVDRHTATTWTVAFTGFAPGFGYLVPDGGGWDVPRRPTPRTRVPPGAVAVAGGYSGVYPRASPGGWQLIGRTPLTVFDVDRDPPALLAPGTRVRFVARDG